MSELKIGDRVKYLLPDGEDWGPGTIEAIKPHFFGRNAHAAVVAFDNAALPKVGVPVSSLRKHELE